MSLIDLFKEFHSEAIQQEFPPSARVLYYTLLGEFNRAHWTDKLVFSVRDLTKLTGLTKSSVDRAIHFLTSRHIIKRTPFKNKTAFSLCGTVAGQSRDSRGTPETNSIIRVREDVKDVKTKSSSSARAREKIDEAQEHWELKKGGRLTFEHLSELQVLIDKHGLEWLKARMTEASDANGNSHGLSMKFFRAFIKRYLKGGEKVETASPSYAKPTRTGDEPWANY